MAWGISVVNNSTNSDRLYTYKKDTRAKSLQITESGYKLTIEANQVVNRIDNDFFHVFDSKVTDLNGYLHLILDGDKSVVDQTV